jgi:hypothetical protein
MKDKAFAMIGGAIGQLPNPLAVGCRNPVVRSFPESIFRKEQHKAHGFEI